MSLLFDFVSVSGANWLFSVASLTCQTSSVTRAAKSFCFFPSDDEVQLNSPPVCLESDSGFICSKRVSIASNITVQAKL